MKDPYKVLGVSPTATDEEVKKAYRDLARKYHPDNYQDSNLADLAEEKMKEVNEAYDTIQDMRSGKKSSGQNSYNYGHSYGGGTSTDARFNEIRMMINQRRYSEAEMRLDAMSNADRNAEWNFLKACVLAQRGHFFDAQKYIETACYMDPNNTEYHNFRADLNNRARRYGRGYNAGYNTTSSGGCDICSVCQTLICLDCCCECMGGDLIGCC